MVAMHVAPRLVALVRHGKAESGEEGSDHARRLTSKGRSDAVATGQWLAGRLDRVDLVWVSSARRAKETWTALSGALPAAGEVLVERELYQAGAREVLDRVARTDVPVMVVVGHNPTLEHAVLALTGSLHGLRPGSAAIIERDADGGGSLVELWTPPR